MGKLAAADSKFPKRDMTLPSLLAKQVDEENRLPADQLARWTRSFSIIDSIVPSAEKR